MSKNSKRDEEKSKDEGKDEGEDSNANGVVVQSLRWSVW
jgi:hypothetical protein